ncbi:MAG: MBL fold metallo-hydrolase [Desulfarculus sp.]|nr:MAG: MBL fold metallo-hydrolase [Desulfarculus sp.]
MEIRFCLLGSGSKGNCLYVEAGQNAVLIDCGLSARQTLSRLEARGLSPHLIRAIILTHEHRDHVQGLRVLAQRLRVPVMCTGPTWRGVPDQGPTRQHAIRAGRPFLIDGLAFHPFSISHDAADPVGLVIAAGQARLGLATDLGVVTHLVRHHLAGCQGLILEHNHDPQMLAQGPYQQWLKQRVRSNQGHLSNEQGAELLGQLRHPQLRRVVLAHLSEVNNRPELAGRAAAQALAQGNCAARLSVARQHEPSQVLEI